MEVLTRQNIEKQGLSIFLRDLSADVNTNLKHMIEDMVNDEKRIKELEKKKKNKNKSVVKKKDIIIQQQSEKRRLKEIEDDMNRITFFLETLNKSNPLETLLKLKTIEGKNKFKYELLKKYWEEDKKKYMKYIIVLFYELKEVENYKEDSLVLKIEKTLRKCDTKEFMMEKMGNMLKPLDHWNNHQKKFDDWQKKVIKYISNNESVIVKAPTSAGKSFIAMACGILHKKILYVCPAKPVAYQVGSHFIHMGYKVHFLLDNISHFSYSPQTNIFIGTPSEIENNLMKIGTHFNYVVFDEIHNVNKEEDGDIYENIIKLIDCNFLALSATINNVDYLAKKLVEMKPKHKIKYIEYTKRFINHQRWVWKNEGLKKLHPLCVFDSIDDEYNESNLSFTPNDCSTIWEKIYDIFEDIDEETNILDKCSPDDFIVDSRMLTLDDCRDYENMIKSKLQEWNLDYPKEVQKVFDSFKDVPDSNKNSDIISFIRETKYRKMFPMIMFNTNESECRNLFNSIYEYLSNKELEEYPYHYDILEKKEELYQEYLKKRETYRDNIKVTSTNAQYEIKEKMDIFDKKQKNEYITKIISYYETKKSDIQKNEDISEKVRMIQEKNLNKEINSFIVNPYFGPQDVFSKHPDFIFTTSSEPMSADTIREVRREIKNTLGVKIPYESALFQMLKRGIGIFLENMPDEYNWQLQKLLSKKEIGIVISDKTLCLGIDLPVKTTCFLGLENSNDFSKDDYLQMSGRAGRRGKDTQGNVIFFGDLDYLDLMKSNHPDIKGSEKPIYDNYKALPSKMLRGNSVFKNMINEKREHIEIKNAVMNEEGRKLLWSLRSYPNACYFILNMFNIEKELYVFSETMRDSFLLEKLSSLICDKEFSKTKEQYKLKKIRDISMVGVFREYLYVLQCIYNNSRKDKYMIIVKNSKLLFDEINRMIFNFII